MTEYLNAVIYKIYPLSHGEKGDIYIGSTILSLNDEFQEHIENCYRPIKKVMYDTERLFIKYGSNNCEVSLIETFPCNSKEVLEKRTNEIIRKLNKVR